MKSLAKVALAQVALDHLTMVDATTALPEMRMHCHFAKLFLELALEQQQEPLPIPSTLEQQLSTEGAHHQLTAVQMQIVARETR